MYKWRIRVFMVVGAALLIFAFTATGNIFGYLAETYITGIETFNAKNSAVAEKWQITRDNAIFRIKLAEFGLKIPEKWEGKGSVSYRHNNPLNLKYGKTSAKYGAIKGQKAIDGGYYAYFESTEDAINASVELLKGENYKNLSVNSALKIWSNKGYDGSIAPTVRSKKVKDLTDIELTYVISAMQIQEGWTL